MIPKHVAIIMDGNRRWSRAHKLPVLEGHRRVATEVLESLVERGAKLGVKYMTFWAFSTENWGRSPQELKGIMMILRKSVGFFGGRMHKKGVKLRTIGNLSKFDPDIQDAIEKVVKLTEHNTRITVILALNYGGRDEMVRAMRMIDTAKNMTEEKFSALLDTAGIPNPELIIRTGGEQRLSGFLLWQSEYSELYFPAWYMPDFTPARLDAAIQEFAKRKRRFGK